MISQVRLARLPGPQQGTRSVAELHLLASTQADKVARSACRTVTGLQRGVSAGSLLSKRPCMAGLHS